jgi:hypothetical protein
LFEFATHRQTFNFPKLFTYGCFSWIIWDYYMRFVYPLAYCYYFFAKN